MSRGTSLAAIQVLVSRSRALSKEIPCKLQTVTLLSKACRLELWASLVSPEPPSPGDAEAEIPFLGIVEQFFPGSPEGIIKPSMNWISITWKKNHQKAILPGSRLGGPGSIS